MSYVNKNPIEISNQQTILFIQIVLGNLPFLCLFKNETKEIYFSAVLRRIPDFVTDTAHEDEAFGTILHNMNACLRQLL